MFAIHFEASVVQQFDLQFLFVFHFLFVSVSGGRKFSETVFLHVRPFPDV